MKLNIKHVFLFAIGLSATPVLAAVLFAFQSGIARAESPAASAVAAKNLFGDLSIGRLPAFTSAFDVALPPEAQSLLKVDRIAAGKGDLPGSKIPLSVWQTAFGATDLSPAAAVQLGQVAPQISANLSLGDFKFLGKTTIGEFYAANPQLINANIPGLPKLTTTVTNTFLNRAAAQVSNQNTLLDLPSLAKVPVASVPGFMDTALGKYPAINASVAADVPGLNTIPLTKFPLISGKIAAGLPLGKIDTVNKGEKFTRKVVSGSNKQPNAPCKSDEKKCDYVELLGIGNPLLNGATMVSADSQTLKGGVNFPGELVNGGNEPPGITPFGDTVKLSFSNVNPKSDTVRVNMNFRACWSMFFYTTCTPYFIGEIPLFEIKAGSQFPLPLGNIEVPFEVTAGNIAAVLPIAPVAPKSSAPVVPTSAPAVPADPVVAPVPAISQSKNSVLDAFLASMPAQDPSLVRNLGCNDSGCTGLIGAYQLRSDNPAVQKFLNAAPGGKEVLNAIASGKPVNAAELVSIFPIDSQLDVLKSSVQGTPDRVAATLIDNLAPNLNWSAKLPTPVNPLLNLPLSQVILNAK
jgi:hypothetical protein